METLFGAFFFLSTILVKARLIYKSFLRYYPKMPEKLISKLHEWRLRNHLTQEELAKEIGVTRQTIIAIERGNYAPSITLALRLAKTLKTKVENIFRLE